MEQSPITILDKSFEQAGVIDTNYSIVWVEKYDDVGEFTLELPMSFSTDDRLQIGNHISIKESKKLMRIADKNPVKNEETGDIFTLKGPSVEVTLSYRVTDDRWFLDGNLQNLLLTLIDTVMINSVDSVRNIDNFILVPTIDGVVDIASITNTFDPGNLFDIVQTACRDMNLGFKVIYNHELGQLEFCLYSGVDRSYDQVENDHVIFSESYGNVTSANYYLGTNNYANVAIVLVDDPIHPRTVVYFGEDEPSGEYRREILIDATDINRSVPDEPDLTDDQLLEVIYRRGWDELLPLLPKGVFDGEVDTQGQFKFGEDFDIGDIVQCVFMGIDTKARVTEYVYTSTSEGVVVYVSFEFNIITDI